MSTSKSDGSDRRYSDICGATNNRDEPCKLPAGWGTPGSGGRRCRFHGGCSTGPSETSHLEGNDFAEGNPGGGAPKGNANAEIHGGFSDWQKAYERFDEETKAHVDRLRECMRETAKANAPDVPEERRERLIKEKATLSVLWKRAAADTLGTPENPVDGARGIVIEEEYEHNGETYTIEKANPAWKANHILSGRQRQIAKELRLWPGFQE
ncbi:hypothetical protein [Natronomonas salsuginis]|uniref:Uncharacterized protein n=1 Tax=Natronomonas salsuginis TaxID=2217661 RepID=A0A4U5J839_9EURY|nr:hypothetical protein [Natronomonas salsuginis]TKR24341.1 hypothetical protein DM868_14875 [Natronomonas salsuginis]